MLLWPFDKLVLTWKTIGTGDMNSSPITIDVLNTPLDRDGGELKPKASFLVEIHIRNE
ncbi:hypothetical protein BCR33DRAFT_724493 [Rhizoclosmatium globosum]|uniref:Uncharacterized protein n=1 Tax=Rhizoclosmatium globosum TaxID=329046 RepID=A0A1Y2B7S9_9FUNG|nr:hypothetical protein BCR33DRAFT_724493 [Rhizoclosmatium globosum]|eukprot:ORY30155.1 hypothetical protein BCR33DRAFT_724493 [Rhizoclosmatium globosum]